MQGFRFRTLLRGRWTELHWLECRDQRKTMRPATLASRVAVSTPRRGGAREAPPPPEAAAVWHGRDSQRREACEAMLSKLWEERVEAEDVAALALTAEQLQALIGPLLSGAKRAVSTLQASEIAAAKAELKAQQARHDEKLETTRTASEVTRRNVSLVQETEFQRRLEEALKNAEGADELAAAKAEQEALQIEAEKLEVELKSQDDALQRTSKLYRQSDNKAKELERQLAVAQSSLEQREKQLAVAHAEVERAVVRQKELSSALDQQRAKATAEQERLRGEVAKLGPLEAELAEERRIRRKLAQALTDHEHSHREAVARMNGLESLVEAALRGEVTIDVCRASLDELRAEVHKLEKARALSSDQVERYRLRLEEAQRAQQALEGQIGQLCEKSAADADGRRALEAKVAELEAELEKSASAREREAALEAKLMSATELAKSRERQALAAEGELRSAKLELELAGTEIASLAEEERKQRAVCQRAVEAMEAMQKQLASATSALGGGEEAESLIVLKVREEARRERQQLVKTALASLHQLRIYLTAKLTGLRAELSPTDGPQPADAMPGGGQPGAPPPQQQKQQQPSPSELGGLVVARSLTRSVRGGPTWRQDEEPAAPLMVYLSPPPYISTPASPSPPGQLSVPPSLDSRRREAELRSLLRSGGGDGITTEGRFFV